MIDMNSSFGENTRRKPKELQKRIEINQHGRIPPQAIDLEEAVIGAMLLEQHAVSVVIETLKPEVFYKEAHQQIFNAIMVLFAKNEPIDILTVTNELKSMGLLEQVGGAYYITMLTNRVTSSANIEFHARILQQKYIQRELIAISSEIIRDSFEDTTDVLELLDRAEKNLFSISDNNLRSDAIDMRILVKDAIKEIEKARNSETHLTGVPSGFTELDRITNGWQKSDLIIIAARPGMGKTAFVLSMARNIAVDHKRPIVVFSLEMNSLQLVTRLISSESQLPADKLKKGNLEDYEWEQLNVKVASLIDAPLVIDDSPGLNLFELRAKCRRMKQRFDVELIIIDYLQLMTAASDTRGGNREQEISNISRSLKNLAKELNVPIIALSQLSRAVETRGGTKRPILSDLRESGAIEQDADMVLFIYRPEYYKLTQDEQGNSTEGMAEIIIAKHRNGALKDIQLQFIDKFAKFCDFETDYSMYTNELPANNQFDTPNNRIVPSSMNDDGFSIDESPLNF
ncbi:MAG: replicative DNA helicase [Bacteroidota bacterium]